MKHISISYTPTAEDYISYSKKAEPALFYMRIKRMMLPFAIMMIAGFFFDIYLSILSFSFFLISNLAPAMLNREYVKKQEKSKFTKRPVTVDFYEDHIVYSYNPDENFKGRGERHYGFKAINGVVESEEYIYFLTKAANIINIPKRVLQQEEYDMLKNLIDNLFSNKYQKI